MFALPDLPYGYSDLAPVLSETTLLTHHRKHHARYVEVVNALLAAQGRRPPVLEDVVIEAAWRDDRKLFNNAAQAWNHGFFWVSMRPGGAVLEGELFKAVTKTFGGSAGLREAFLAQGAGHFGSGWVWLAARGKALSVMTTHDAATPLTDPGTTPLLVCDLWEHAYYLDHKNDRAAFLAGWWDQLADWSFAQKQFDAARRGGAGWRYPAAGLEASQALPA
jgi:Fe-Mn family superoxide dismutase